MRAETITSGANPLIKKMRKLRQRKHREREHAFLVEGIAQVWAAVQHKADVEVLVVASELLTSEAARALVEREAAQGTRVAEVSRAIFEEVTERDHPSGLAAVVRMHQRDVADLRVDPSSVWVVLHEVGNPGNLGSILRSVDASGATGVVVSGNSPAPFHPSAVKSSMGTLFTIPVCHAASLDQVFDRLRAAGATIVATSAKARVGFRDIDYPRPLALLFGSEATGLPPEVLERADVSVRIPMYGTASSLNLAVAVGLLVYEVERRGAGSDPGRGENGRTA